MKTEPNVGLNGIVGMLFSDFEGWSFESITDREGMFDLCIEMLHFSQFSRRIRESPSRGSAAALPQSYMFILSSLPARKFSVLEVIK